MDFLFDILGVELVSRAQKRWPNTFLPLVMLALLALVALLLWITFA